MKPRKERLQEHTDTTLWRPAAENIAQSQISNLISKLGRADVVDFPSLYRFSVQEPENFWKEVAECCQIIGEMDSSMVFRRDSSFRKSRWFPTSKLNFAENLLPRSDEATALVFYGERQERRTYSWSALRKLVFQLRHFFRQQGVEAGDVIAAITANTPETIAAMLAASSLGAGWCSVAPEFGPTGILERFEQISPKILVASDRYFYKGKAIELTEKVAQ